MPKIVGIDLGTTNSVIAVMEGNEPTVISLAEGTRLCPSVVGFSRTGERLVGQLAKRQALAAPERTIGSIKRHMGTEYVVEIDNKQFTPQEISALILQKLKTDAESYLGENVDKGRDYGSRLLFRRAAAGYQRRRNHRGPGSGADHQ